MHKTNHGPRSIPVWVWMLVGVNLLMGLANVVTFAVTRYWNLEPTPMFRLSDEANVPTWWSSAQLLMIGVLLSILAYRLISLGKPQAWLMTLPALLFLFLSMDEVATIHEEIGHRWGPESLRTGMWVVIAVPLFLIAMVVIVRAVWPFLKGRTQVIRLYAWGFGVALFSAVGLELAANLYPDQSIQVHVLVLLEEVGEMMGGTLMLWATAEWVASFGIRLLTLDTEQRAAGAATANSANRVNKTVEAAAEPSLT